MRNRIVVIEHHPEQKDDRASQHLSAMGFDLDWRKPWQGDDLSIAIDDIAGSVIYGGIQNVGGIIAPGNDSSVLAGGASVVPEPGSLLLLLFGMLGLVIRLHPPALLIPQIGA